MATEQEFGFRMLRVTYIREALVLRRGSIALEPVIDDDGDPYGISRFSHWTVRLTVPWWRGLSLSLHRLLRKVPVAIEFWTELEPPEERYDAVHWMFPYVFLRRTGFRTWEGTTSSGNGVVVPDCPDNAPITSGAFWKTKGVPA